jgi:hypothetical protein
MPALNWHEVQVSSAPSLTVDPTMHTLVVATEADSICSGRKLGTSMLEYHLSKNF